MINGLFHDIAGFPLPSLENLAPTDPLIELTGAYREGDVLRERHLQELEWNVVAAELEKDLGRYDEAIAYSARARSLSTQSENAFLQARALAVESISLLKKGRIQEAVSPIAKLDLLAENSDAASILGLHSFCMGYSTVFGYEGESDIFERASLYFEPAIHYFEEAEEVSWRIRAMVEYADVSCGNANYASALRICLDALNLCAEHGEWRNVGRILLVASTAATDQGYRLRVEETLRKSIRWSEFLNDPWGAMQGYFALGRLLGYEMPAGEPGKTDGAVGALAMAVDVGESIHAKRQVQKIKLFFAWIYGKSGEEARRQEWLKKSGLYDEGDTFVHAVSRDADVITLESNRHIMTQLQGAIQQNPDAFFLFESIRDEDKCVDFLNPYRNDAANEMFGANATSFCTLSDVRDNEFVMGLDEPLYAAVLERISFEDLIVVDRAAQGPRSFARRIFPTDDGAVLTIRDVTDAQHVQQAHMESARKAQRSERIKSEFLANMSHEVRTPLNGILGLARLLAETPLDEDQLAYVQDIVGSGNILLAVIGDVLDLSKLEASSMQIENKPVDLADLIKNTVGLYRGQAQEKGLILSHTVDGDLPEYVLADAARLRQILGNLVGNAVKFTERGLIEVKVSAEGDVFTFAVSDTGPGIPSDRLDSVFDRFHQEGSDQGGTGLGLTISKRLGELMGGSMWVESTLGTGSRFMLRVRLDRSEAPKTDLSLASCRFDQSHILLVEDNRVNAIVSTRQLEKVGCTVTWAKDGLHALDILSQTSFDLVFMDVRMPVMNGLDATRELRKREGRTRTPVVALTAGAFVDERKECFDAGMDDHLSKPFTPESLTATLSRWLPQTPVSDSIPSAA